MVARIEKAWAEPSTALWSCISIGKITVISLLHERDKDGQATPMRKVSKNGWQPI
jgi:hypothetical protein